MDSPTRGPQVAGPADLANRGDPDLITNLLRITRFETLTERASNVVLAAYGAEARSAVDRAIERERDDASRTRLEALRSRLPAE